MYKRQAVSLVVPITAVTFVVVAVVVSDTAPVDTVATSRAVADVVVVVLLSA